MIIDREDYVTKEEYEDKLAIYNDIQRIVSEIKDTESYMEKHKYNYDYHWREKSCNIWKTDYHLSFDLDNDIKTEGSIRTDILNMLGIKEEMKLISEEIYYKYTIYNDLSRLSKVDNIYPYLVEFIDKYKDKTITVEQFDNREKFKEIYDTIKSLEEKYEYTTKN